MLLKKLFVGIAKLFGAGPPAQPAPAAPVQRPQGAAPGAAPQSPQSPPPVQAEPITETAETPVSRRLSVGKRSFVWDGELLRARIKYISDYPIPRHSEDGISLAQWIGEHGLPYERRDVIRLLAAFGRRLPSSEEIAVIQRSGNGLRNNGSALLWVRNARDRLYALSDSGLRVPDSGSFGQLALLSVWDRK